MYLDGSGSAPMGNFHTPLQGISIDALGVSLSRALEYEERWVQMTVWVGPVLVCAYDDSATGDQYKRVPFTNLMSQ